MVEECSHLNVRHIPGVTTTAGEDVDIVAVCADCGAMRMWGIGWLDAIRNLDKRTKQFLALTLATDHCDCGDCGFHRLMDEHDKKGRHDPASCQVCQDYELTAEDQEAHG